MRIRLKMVGDRYPLKAGQLSIKFVPVTPELAIGLLNLLSRKTARSIGSGFVQRRNWISGCIETACK